MGVYFRNDAITYSGSIFKNNIVIEDDVTSRIPVYIKASHAGFTFDYNNYNETVMAGAQGANDTIGNPYITKGAIVEGSLTRSYFTLLSQSPAIGRGVDLGFDRDFVDTLRSTPPDIGAIEYIPPDPPDWSVVLTNAVTKLWVRGVVGNGNVISDGGGTVSDRGICWNTTVDPVITDSHIHLGTGVGVFSAELIGLIPNTTYHIRSFSINEKGTSYGDDVEFTTPIYTVLKNGTKVLVSGGKILTVGGNYIDYTFDNNQLTFDKTTITFDNNN
jgi:hypothetical protein